MLLLNGDIIRTLRKDHHENLPPCKLKHEVKSTCIASAFLFKISLLKDFELSLNTNRLYLLVFNPDHKGGFVFLCYNVFKESHSLLNCLIIFLRR